MIYKLMQWFDKWCIKYGFIDVFAIEDLIAKTAYIKGMEHTYGVLEKTLSLKTDKHVLSLEDIKEILQVRE
jgi:hypothetical protein